MSVTTKRHDARLDFRLSREAREKIEKAARVSGQSLSDFAASTLLRAASEVLESHQQTVLSERDFARFAALLSADEEPTETAKLAAAEYREGRVEGARYQW